MQSLIGRDYVFNNLAVPDVRAQAPVLTVALFAVPRSRAPFVRLVIPTKVGTPSLPNACGVAPIPSPENIKTCKIQPKICLKMCKIKQK